jgi:hypothetical protein
VVVGQQAGPAPTVRNDAHRDGLTTSAFPRAPLKIDWHFAVGGGQIEQPPVITNEAIIVVTTHGEVVWVPHDAHDGRSEIARQTLGIAATSTSPPAITSDGTVVVVGGASEASAVGIDKSGVRFRTQLGGRFEVSEAIDAVAPLALDDGGVVVATSSEIALLDATGNVRLRAALPDAFAGPLLAGGSAPTHRIFGVTKAGVVYAWAPGGANGRDVVRVGSFQGSGVQGGAIMTSDDTLLAVVGDSRLMTLDVRQGLSVPLATFAGGAYLGPVAYRRGVAYAMAGVTARTFAIAIDASGQEVLRVPVATSPLVTGDAGAVGYVVPAHVPIAVDDTGTLAFAAPDGPIGVVDPAGVVTSLDGVCTRMRQNGRAATSITTDGPGAFVVTCASSHVVRIVHGQGAVDTP